MAIKLLHPEIKSAVTILKNAGAKKVYLFGSVLRGNLESASDIDLGITGLPPESFFAVYARLSEILPCPVDLVDFDKEQAFFNLLQEINEVKEIG